MQYSNQNFFLSLLLRGFHEITAADLSTRMLKSPHPHHIFCLPTVVHSSRFPENARLIFLCTFELFSLPNVLPLDPTLVMMKQLFENEYFCSNIDYIILYLFVYRCYHLLEYELYFALAIGKEVLPKGTCHENWSCST